MVLRKGNGTRSAIRHGHGEKVTGTSQGRGQSETGITQMNDAGRGGHGMKTAGVLLSVTMKVGGRQGSRGVEDSSRSNMKEQDVGGRGHADGSIPASPLTRMTFLGGTGSLVETAAAEDTAKRVRTSGVRVLVPSQGQRLGTSGSKQAVRSADHRPR
jgi:hypothetical protein